MKHESNPRLMGYCPICGRYISAPFDGWCPRCAKQTLTPSGKGIRAFFKKLLKSRS